MISRDVPLFFAQRKEEKKWTKTLTMGRAKGHARDVFRNSIVCWLAYCGRTMSCIPVFVCGVNQKVN